MPVIAKLNNLRIAPRKVRLIADLIRGKNVHQALDALTFVSNKTAKPMAKLLNSAIANAKNNFQLASDNLYVATIFVNEGTKLKRSRPRSRGQANEIIKRSSHITLILEEKGKKIEKKEPIIEKKEIKPEKKAAPKKKVVKKVKTIKKTSKKS